MRFFLGDAHVHSHAVTKVTNSSQFSQGFLSFHIGSLLSQSSQSLATQMVGYLSSGHPDH